jgi:FMN reductase
MPAPPPAPSPDTARFHVVALSGSPAPASRTAGIADHLLGLIAARGIATRHVRLADIDPAALLGCDPGHPALAPLAAAVAESHGVIIATPIYKASYSGLLKAGLDVLPQFALAGKAVLPVGTGGSVAHVLALDYALRPVLQSMGARHVVQAHFVAEKDVRVGPDGAELVAEAAAPLGEALRNFLHSLTDLPEAQLLGHPRPGA